MNRGRVRTNRIVTDAGLLAAAIAIPFLSGCTKNETVANNPQKGASLLTLWSPPTPQEAAAWAVDPYDADKRYRGTLLLANAPWGGEAVYLDLYRAATKDGDPSVRAAAIRGLALHGEPTDVPVILGHFDDPDRLLRWECARALQRLHNPEAVAPLLKHLQERNETEPIVRAASANALGQYAEPRVLEGLIGGLSDRDLSVNIASQDALRTLTGQDLGLDVREWVAWRKATESPFAGRQPYEYPVFHRSRHWYEWVPMVGKPPNETPAAPVGLDGATRAAATTRENAPVEEPGFVRDE